MAFFEMENLKILGKKTLKLGNKGLISGTKYTAKAAKLTAEYIYDHREQITGAAVGLGKGVFETGKGIYGHTITDEQVKKGIDKLTEQSEEFGRLNKIYSDKLMNADNQKQIFLDSIIMSSAFSIHYINTHTIPPDINEAFQLAYPNLSENYTLTEIINTSSPEELSGYANAIKGKLFEMRYVDYLNNRILPDGYTASLADSTTNPGWDIQIIDNFGNISEQLQLKATDSISYVYQALLTYPNIDIVTTEEVYNQLALSGISDHVINSGISNDELTSVITESLNNADFQMDWVPSIIPFLIIGYSVSRKDYLNSYQKGKEFGSRSFSSWIAYIAGGAVTGLTGFWLAGLGTVILSNYGLETGRRKLQRYLDLKKTIDSNEQILNRMKFKITSI